MKITMPTATLDGRFRLVVSSDAEGKDVKHDTGVFTNLITDVGLHAIGQVGMTHQETESAFALLCGRFVVGSGQRTPSFTDTTLQTPVAFATSNASLVSEVSNWELGYCEMVFRFQFGQGVAQGNLTEIGIQRTNVTGPLWSRALIVDQNGAPTAITVLDTDFLTCEYYLRIYMPKDDVLYPTKVSYDGVEEEVLQTIRTLGANSAGSAYWGLFTFMTNHYYKQPRFYSGGLSLPTATAPLGTAYNGENHTGTTNIFPYDPVNAPYTKYIQWVEGLNFANSQTLSTLRVPCFMGCYQVNFNPPLRKNNTQTLTMILGFSWARHDPDS